METVDWMSELNPRQREAVTHGDGPVLVVGGAGSGKTKTLAARVAYLISQGVPPERILLLTVAFCLVKPGIYSDILGLAGFALVYLLQKQRLRSKAVVAA